MSITSIGYGDISPTHDVEYVVCSVCMLGGGILWAYLIGSVRMRSPTYWQCPFSRIYVGLRRIQLVMVDCAQVRQPLALQACGP